MTREEKKEELIGLFSTVAIFIGDLIDECFEFGQQHPHWISVDDVDKMVMEYSQTKDGDFGLPVNCMIKAYKKGINDALKLSLNLEKQGNKLDPDEVIEWLKPYNVIVDNIIDKFKKDFGL